MLKNLKSKITSIFYLSWVAIGLFAAYILDKLQNRPDDFDDCDYYIKESEKFKKRK